MVPGENRADHHLMGKLSGPSAPSRVDRIRSIIDRVLHPRLSRSLARATDGFRSQGVIRTYANDAAGRRREALETALLWRHGYRPPVRLVRDAIWRVGAPTIVITFNRERNPVVMTPRDRAVAEWLDLLSR